MALSSQNDRSRNFYEKNQNRYWWHKIPASTYIPPLYSFLTDQEWSILEEWYKETDEANITGEIAIPFMSIVQGFMMGNGLSRIVQLGHYAGYSSMLLGFMLKKMNFTMGLYSIDIDPVISKFTKKWIERAGLGEYVSIQVGDSADPAFTAQSIQYLKGKPQLILLDSSHQYDHTLKELGLWIDSIEYGGFILMHDSSVFAEEFDSFKRGGASKALHVWSQDRSDISVININSDVIAGMVPSTLVYRDGCGIGIIQKRYASQTNKATGQLLENSNSINKEERIISSQMEIIAEKQRIIVAQTKLIDEKDDAVRAQTRLIDERDEVIRSQTKLINERDKDIQQKDHIIQDLELRRNDTFAYRIKNCLSKILKR